MGPLKIVESLERCDTWQNLRVSLCLGVGGTYAFRPPTSRVRAQEKELQSAVEDNQVWDYSVNWTCP